jgi:hypothetical protein
LRLQTRRTRHFRSAARRSSRSGFPPPTSGTGTGENPTTPEPSDGWREACAGLPLSHMGRGPDEDPDFFAAAYGAGVAARALLG